MESPQKQQPTSLRPRRQVTTNPQLKKSGSAPEAWRFTLRIRLWSLHIYFPGSKEFTKNGGRGRPTFCLVSFDPMRCYVQQLLMWLIVHSWHLWGLLPNSISIMTYQWLNAMPLSTCTFPCCLLAPLFSKIGNLFFKFKLTACSDKLSLRVEKLAWFNDSFTDTRYHETKNHYDMRELQYNILLNWFWQFSQ